MKRYSLLLLLSCYGYTAFGQWNSDSTRNTLVCNATAQQAYPRVATDPSKNVFVVWQDSRHSGYTQVYIQKFDANGNAKWTANGIRVCSTAFVQRGPIVAADDNGGAYVVWQDDRHNGTPNTRPDLYAQHLSSDGNLLYGAGGRAIEKVMQETNDASMQKNWTILADGLGNAYVAWEDNRASITPSSSRPDIYMTRLWPGGVKAPDTGIAVHNAPARQTEPYLIRDTLNRCFMAFTTNYSVAPYGVAVTPIDTSLNVLWGTSNNPNVIYRNGNFSQNSARPRVVKYAGMYYLAWEELQTGAAGWDILAQKLSNAGSPVWFTPAEMTPSLSGDQTKAVPNTDYAGGMQVVYEDFQGNRNISSSRMLADGASRKPASPNHIYTVCNLTNDQRNPAAVPTEKGMLVFWEDDRKSASNTSIFAQVIDTTPLRQYPVPGSRWGFPVSTDVGPSFSAKDQLDIVARENGAVVVWRDSRNYSTTNNDIYMQLVFKNATLPVELADFRLTRQLTHAVRVDWQTAMEKDNAGFEIERRHVSGQMNDFEVIASYKQVPSLQGSNNSSTLRSYSYLDVPSSAGTYEYRLVDYSLDGERTVHSTREIEFGAASASAEWVMLAASPNPFRDRTSISFIAPRPAIVDLQVIDQLGRIVSTPLNNSTVSSGPHTVVINALELGASGTYYYQLSARDAETGEVIFSGKPSVLNSIR